MKKHKYTFLLLFISLLFLSPFFGSNFYSTHDGENHIARFAAYYKAFADGQIPPRWAGDLNYRYGTPVLIFFYPLPGYIASFLHLLHIPFEKIFLLIMGLSFFLSGIFFFYWSRKLFKESVAFFGSLLYLLAPFHFLNLFVRGDIGEMMAYMCIPLVFLSLENIFKKTNVSAFVLLGAVSYAGLILSHNGVSLFFTPVIVAYVLLFKRSARVYWYCIGMLLLGLGLSAFFWLPALVDARYVMAHHFLQSVYKEHFSPLLKLLYSPWGFGADINRDGGLSPQIGLALGLGSVLALLSLKKLKDEKRRYVLFWGAVCLFALFLVTSYSSFLWNSFPLLRYYQFPWRFVGLATFAASVLVMFPLSLIKSKRWELLLIVVIILFSLQFLQVQKIPSRTENYYSDFPGTTFFHREATPIWTAGDAGEFPDQKIQIIAGEGKVSNYTRMSNLHMFSIEATSDVSLRDSTFYFPGWKVFVDGRNTPIEFQDGNHRGIITFSIPKGRHDVMISFNETKIRFLADIITVISLVVLLVMLILHKTKRRSTRMMTK